MLLEQEVAQKTGESRRTIRQRGFQIAIAECSEFELELPQMIDWDELYRVTVPRMYRPSDRTH